MIGNTYHGIRVECFIDDRWVMWVVPNVQRVYFASPSSFWLGSTMNKLGHINIDFKHCEVTLSNDFYSICLND